MGGQRGSHAGCPVDCLPRRADAAARSAACRGSSGYLSLASARGARGDGNHMTYGEEMHHLAEDRLEQVLTPWRGRFAAVDVAPVLRTDAPAKALNEAAGTAGLLV